MSARGSVRPVPVLPGFRLTLGFTLAYLVLVVLAPLVSLPLVVLRDVNALWETLTDERVRASFGLTLRTSLTAAAINGVAGLVVAWVLVRYDFPARRLVDALVDLPLALPTAVAGITLTTLYAPTGWVGEPLARAGIDVAFTPLGITLALVFVGLPFVVRTLQPVLSDLDPEVEEAAASLGAPRWQAVSRVVLPGLVPAWLTGVTLALARALGEYGSVVFIAGNLPYRTEVPALLVVTRLEEYDYPAATAIAFGMLVLSFGLLWTINGIQVRAARRMAA